MKMNNQLWNKIYTLRGCLSPELHRIQSKNSTRNCLRHGNAGAANGAHILYPILCMSVSELLFGKGVGEALAASDLNHTRARNTFSPSE